MVATRASGGAGGAIPVVTDRKSWPARKERHLVQIAEGSTLPPIAYRVAIVLSSYLNSDTGEAFPSQLTLAKRLGLDVGSDESDKRKCARKRADAFKRVRRGVQALVDAGHYAVEWGNGHRLYRPIICETELSRTAICETELSQVRDKAVSGARQNCPPNLTTEPEKEPCTVGAARSEGRTAGAWDDVLAFMQKEVGKVQAKTWLASCRLGGVENDVALVVADTRTVAGWVANNFGDTLRLACKQVLGVNEVRVVTEPKADVG